MLQFLASYLIMFLGVIIITFFLGFYYISLCFPVIFNQVKSKPLHLFSFSITVGYILSTALIAVCYTFFDTIFIWVFVLMLIPLVKISKSYDYSLIKNYSFPSLKKIILFLIIGLVVFFYNSLLYFRYDRYLFFDLVFYGKIALGITEYGYESANLVYASFQDTAKQFLYHYGDLWIVGVNSKITDFPAGNILVYVMYPYLHFILLCIILTLFNGNKKIALWNILLGLGLLYGSKLFVNNNINNQVLHSIQRYRGFPFPIFHNKILPIYVLCTFAILLYKLDFKKYSFVIFSFVPVFYSTTIPAFASISIGMLFMTIFCRKLNIKRWEISLVEPLILFGSILFIVIFSLLRPFEVGGGLSIELYSLKTYIIVFLETIIKVFGEYLLLFILLIYTIIKTRGTIFFNPMIFLSVIGLFGGFLFIYTQTPRTTDIEQALSNISPILVLIIGIETFSYLKWKYKKTAIVIMLLCGISNLSYFYFNQNKWGINRSSEILSKDFVKKVTLYNENYTGKVVSCSINTCGYKAKQRWNLDIYNTFQELFISNKIDFPLEIGFLFTKDKTYDTKNHPYFRMYKDHKIFTERILSFINKTKVNHLYINDYSGLPKDFIRNFTLLYKDKNTGGSFWKINNTLKYVNNITSYNFRINGILSNKEKI